MTSPGIGRVGWVGAALVVVAWLLSVALAVVYGIRLAGR